MSDAVALIQRYQNFIYIVLVIGAVWYLRAFLGFHRKLRFSVFGLERETYSLARARSLTLLIVIIAFGGLVFLTGVVDPEDLELIIGAEPTQASLLITAESTATVDQQILLPGQPSPTPAGTPTPVAENTPIPAGSVGCENQQARISSPLPGAVLAGPVEVLGTANIVNFAFYVLEISTLGDNWLTVFTGNVPVIEGPLGTWDASLQSPDNYGFRLIVYDGSGAFPEPCVIPITIGGAP